MNHLMLRDQKKELPLFVGGSGRGARSLLPYIKQYNDVSNGFVLQPTFVDPVPEKARVLSEQARGLGVPAEWCQERIEVATAENNALERILLLSLDRPAAIAEGLRLTVRKPIAVFVHCLLGLPSGVLYGVRMVLANGEDDLKEITSEFFSAIAQVTGRGGSSTILGEQGRAEHIAIEPTYRQWFAKHLITNLPKLAAGLEPESEPFEVTVDGQKTMPLVIEDHGNEWAKPTTLAHEVVEQSPFPMKPGEDFVIGEIGPDGLRFHTVRIRVTDRQVGIQGAAALDEAAIADAIRRAEAEALTRQNRVVGLTD